MHAPDPIDNRADTIDSRDILPPSIHDLFQTVREHPDFAGGAIWTRRDLADALYGDDDNDSTGDPSRVTADQLTDAERVTDDWIDRGPYSWSEAIRDNLDTPGGTR